MSRKFRGYSGFVPDIPVLPGALFFGIKIFFVFFKGLGQVNLTMMF